MNVRHQLRTVDLDALRGNVRLLREALPAGTRLLAVVKADAYGHGMAQVARAAIEAGAAYLAVATAEEGAALRHAGIRDVPVLVLGATTPDAARLGAAEGLTMTVCDPAMVRWMQDAARACGRQGLVHLKLDTGMGRIGARTEAEVAAVLAALDEADVVVVSGGSSAGMRDHTVDVFTSVPGSELLTHGVAISPGKPFILARSGGKCLMGLPGHVSSALVCARAFLVPLLEHLQGSAGDELVPSLTARLTRAVASAQGRRDYIRVKLVPASAAALEAAWLPQGLDCSDVDWLAQPLMKPSGVVSGLVEADGLVICAENREGLTAGERVRVELLA